MNTAIQMVEMITSERKPYPSEGLVQKVFIKEIAPSDNTRGIGTVRIVKEVVVILFRARMEKPIHVKYNPMLAIVNKPNKDRKPSIETSNQLLFIAITNETMYPPKRAKPENETRIAIVPAAN